MRHSFKVNRKCNRFVSAVLLVFFLICMVTPAFAEPYFDVGFEKEGDVQIGLHYAVDDKACSDISFHLYKIADMTDYDTYSWTKDFEKYQLTFTSTTEEGLMSLCDTVSGYIKRDNPKAILSGKTDKTGSLIFKSDKISLTPGIYLVQGDEYPANGRIYTPSEALAVLPFTTEEGLLDYHASLEIKHESRPIPPSGGGGAVKWGSRIVKKVWNNGENKNQPRTVTVQLLKDGKVASTAVLTARNNWTHIFSNLSPKYQWDIVEESVPTGYTVSNSQEGSTITITNTFGEPPVIPPVKPENPTPEDPSNPSTPTEPSESVVNPTDKPDKPVIDKPSKITVTPIIPKTGTTWYLVPIFAGFGVFCFLLSFLPSKKEEGLNQ